MKQAGGPRRAEVSARLRGALVIGEIALASALLVGSGLFLRSFVNLLRVDPGFQPENVLTARIVLPRRSATGTTRRAANSFAI